MRRLLQRAQRSFPRSRANERASSRRRLALACLIWAASSVAANAEETVAALPTAEAAFFEDIPSVFAASKYEQKVTDAPSNVTIVTAEEIRNFGYRTLADLLASVPGFFVTNDRNYSYAGARGFLRPGDYNARVLILVDGHRSNEPVFDSASLARGSTMDMSLIERVEVVRGPGSSLYGTNAFFAIVNVITKRGRDLEGAEAGGTVGSFETYGARLAAGSRRAPGFELLTGASYFDSAGNPRLYFPEFDDPATHDGIADDVDGERGRNLFAKLSWRDLTLTAGYGERNKHIPTGSFGTVFDSPRNLTRDQASWGDLSYAATPAPSWNVAARAYYDRFRERGDYLVDYSTPEAPASVLNVDDITGERVGGEINAATTALADNRVIVGGEYRYNFDLHLRNFDVEPRTPYVDIDKSTVDWALYLQDEYTPWSFVTLQAGLRFDHQQSFGERVSPRAALVTRPLADTTVKLIYGEAFRAPNPYETAYAQGEDGRHADLSPEIIRSYELVAEQALAEQVRLSCSLYHDEISDLIEFVGDATSGVRVPRNRGETLANGVELAVEARTASGIGTRLSYNFVETEDRATHQRLTNSPAHLAKANLSVPVLDDRLVVAPEVLFTSSRKTLSGGAVDSFVLTNLTLRAQRVLGGLGASVTAYNLFDVRYADPVSAEFRQDAIRQDGRTVWLDVDYRFELP